MSRPGRTVRLTATGICLVYGIVLHFAGISLSTGLKKGLAYLPALATLLLVAWDLWAWRWPLLWRSTARPRIAGLWTVTLHPTADSHIPEGGNRGPITAYLVVVQSYWTVALRLFTAESSSISRSFSWESDHHTGTEWLTFVYDNSPMQRHQPRSTRHLGACRLQPGDRQPTEITGMYFTDRYTQGDMQLTFVSRDTDAGSFDEAARLAEAPQRPPASASD